MTQFDSVSFAMGRFRVSREADNYVFHDRLQKPAKSLPLDAFAADDVLERNIRFFQQGFMEPVLSIAPKFVAARPRNERDVFFWQFPCRTEGAAFDVHSALTEVPYLGGELHCYLGLPWATFIDKRRLMPDILLIPRVRLSGLRLALAELGVGLRVHTVCQHIFWRKLIPTWQSLGLTDLWLSHLPEDLTAEDASLPFNLHPWHLFAVNVEDAERCEGIIIGKDPADKKLLASFIGAHMEHYLSDVRLRLRVLEAEEGFLIRLNDSWHFHDVVYQHQRYHKPLTETYQVTDSVRDYNELLSDSIFSLCPAGSGPNSLRLWESLAVGSIPVLLGDLPRLPAGGSLPDIDWDKIVLRIPSDAIAELPALLRRMSLTERRERQRRGLEAYALVQAQRCF